MSAFTTPADLRLLDRHHWELLAPFEYHAGAYPSAVVIRVPTGFVTDLASVPRLFWPIFPPHGRYAKAAILHDWLYAQGGDTADRLSADNIFGEAMQVLGVSAWQRWIIHRAVRLFGAGSFGRRPPPDFDTSAFPPPDAA